MKPHVTEAAIAPIGTGDSNVAHGAAVAEAALESGIGVRSPYERDATIDEVFGARAHERPDAIAVASDSRSLTYAFVERCADRIAAALCRRRIGPGANVGVAFERNVDLPALLLGILKAGAAYVPMDDAYPPQRLAMMRRDASVALVVVDERSARYPETDAPLVDVRALTNEVGSAPDARPHPTSLAYITYTSGSTGRPKGVAVEHRGVLRLVRGQDYTAIEPGDTFLHFAPLAFDASTFELWAPLLGGARLAIPRPGLLSIDELVLAIGRFGVTTMFLTTALFRRLVDAKAALPPSLRHLLTGGEVASASHMRRFLRANPGCRLSAVYGPTENTTFSTWCDIALTDTEGRSVPIGRPIANSTAFVLDDDLRPVPAGVAGELYVGGDGVARGYVNLPEQTAERFLSCVALAGEQHRLYRTGDRARWGAGGLLEFLGRNDDQVKVRGFRIELGEIESVLSAHPNVEHCAVVVTERNDEKELVACVVTTPGADAGALRAHLSRSLPAHMIPHRVVLREQFPLSANGKVDRAALARTAAETAPVPPPAAVALQRPQSETERAIAELWRELLGADHALDENFFDAGGDSLRLLTLHARLRERLGVELSVVDLFQQSTIRKLASLVTRLGAPA